MAKQTIFGRIAQLAKANINSLIDAAEDPEKMLDQMVRDYTNNIREAEAAVAQTIGNLRLLEKDLAEKAAQAVEPQLASQTQVVNQLKDGLEKMRSKLEEVKYKRDELTARQKTAAAQAQVNDALKAFDVLDPTSEMSRFEEKVRREEARVIGQQELAASSLDAQFNTLDQMERDTELDARLAALKAKNAPAAPAPLAVESPTQTL